MIKRQLKKYIYIMPKGLNAVAKAVKEGPSATRHETH